MKLSLQRDLVIESLSSLNDDEIDNIVFITPDFGAKALDSFRIKNNKSFVFPGISEQFSVDYSYGCAVSGKKPIIYGMSPFVTARCIEQFKVLYGQTNLPVLLISVGCGLGYDHNTLSHYSLEDIALFSSIPGFSIVSPFTCESAIKYTNEYISSNIKLHLRLERQSMPNTISDLPDNIKQCEKAFIKEGSAEELIITYGSLGLELIDKSHKSILVLEDLTQIPSTNILSYIHSFSNLHLIEESFEHCGIYSRICKIKSSEQALLHSFIGSDISNKKISRTEARKRYLYNK